MHSLPESPQEDFSARSQGSHIPQYSSGNFRFRGEALYSFPGVWRDLEMVFYLSFANPAGFLHGGQSKIALDGHTQTPNVPLMGSPLTPPRGEMLQISPRTPLAIFNHCHSNLPANGDFKSCSKRGSQNLLNFFKSLTFWEICVMLDWMINAQKFI